MGTLNRYVIAAAVVLVGAVINTAALSQAPVDKTVWDGVYADAQSKRGEEGLEDELRVVPRSASSSKRSRRPCPRMAPAH